MKIVSPEIKIDFIEKTDKKFYDQQLKLMSKPNKWQEFFEQLFRIFQLINSWK